VLGVPQRSRESPRRLLRPGMPITRTISPVMAGDDHPRNNLYETPVTAMFRTTPPGLLNRG